MCACAVAAGACAAPLWQCRCLVFVFVFFNDTATTEIYTLSLHDALPICWRLRSSWPSCAPGTLFPTYMRSEEHTSELQSHSFISYAVFCLKKKKNMKAKLTKVRPKQPPIAARAQGAA